MRLNYATLFFVVFFMFNGFSQKAHNDVLFVVDDEPVYTSEFLKVYNKNLNLVQDESQKDVDGYLELFTSYKLKLKEAKALGFHEKASYIRELENYKKQLAKNYMTDSKVTDVLVKEAYERISFEVKANHILVKIIDASNPSDTLAAYEKINKLRERALSEGFEKVRKEVHNGTTLFGEELGYFSAFRMVYPFESTAFNTPVGEISKPFKTQFGYHIVKILDKRKSRGERSVKHIMLVDKKGDTLSEPAEVRIKEIYQKINQGEEFESLAKHFSDDRNTALKGGLLSPFSSGQIGSKVFEDTAFAMSNVGDISKPIQTKYGWHILKLEEIKEIGAFEKMESELEAKIKRDSRSRLIEDALIQKLKDKYKISKEIPSLKYFVGILNDDFYKRSWVLPEDFKADDVLIKIGDKDFTNKDFGGFLLKYQRKMNKPNKDLNILVTNAYNEFFNTNLKQYQEDNLENENEEYADIVNEYRDGLLLFDLMETTIWKSGESDSLEVKAFYDKNKTKYFWPKRVEATVASSARKKTINRVAKMMKSELSIKDIKKVVNTNGDVNVIFTNDVMDIEHQALPEKFEFKEGLSKVYKHNKSYIVANVVKVLPKTLKTFEEVKGLVISDYQSHKEQSWIEELKEKYKITINQEALKTIKAEVEGQ